MSHKNVLKKKLVIDAGDLSGDLVSLPVSVEFLDNIGIQLNVTGTPTGIFYPQVSMDYDEHLGTGNWVTLPINPNASVSGAANQIYVDLNQMSSPWVRVIYTHTSGSGSVDAYINGKSI